MVALILCAHTDPTTVIFWEMLTSVELPEPKAWKIRSGAPMRDGIDD